MKVLGVDPGGRTGWAVLESTADGPKILDYGEIELPTKSRPLGLCGLELRQQLSEIAARYEIDLIGCENFQNWGVEAKKRTGWGGRWKKADGKDPMRRGSWAATYQCVRLIQAIAELEAGYVVKYVYPVQWQAATCGHAGGAILYTKVVDTLFGSRPKSEHACAAILIALYFLDQAAMNGKTGGVA